MQGMMQIFLFPKRQTQQQSKNGDQKNLKVKGRAQKENIPIALNGNSFSAKIIYIPPPGSPSIRPWQKQRIMRIITPYVSFLFIKLILMASNDYQLAEIPLRFSSMQKIPELIKLDQISMAPEHQDHIYLNTKVSKLLLKRNQCMIYLYRVQTYQHKLDKTIRIQKLTPICMIDKKFDSMNYLQDFLYQAPLDEDQLIDMLRSPIDVNEQDLLRSHIPPDFMRHYNQKPANINLNTIEQPTKQVMVKPYKSLLKTMEFDDNESAQNEYEEDLLAPNDQVLYIHLKNLFEQRPIWIKNSLIYELKKFINKDIKSVNLARCLYRLAYFYKKGPWMHCYVRFGYKPKQNPEAAQYQSFVIAMKDTQIERQYINSKTIYDPSMNIKSTNQRNHYQFCDLTNKQFTDRLQAHSNNLSKQCTIDYGWFTKEQYRGLVRLAKQINQNEND